MNNNVVYRKIFLKAKFFILTGCFFLSDCIASNVRSVAPDSLKNISSKSTGMKLTLIQPGTFNMGSPENEYQSDSNEHPQHVVTLTKPYYIGVYEVTQEEFMFTMGFNPSTIKGSKRLPVETLTWYDAVIFCNRLSELDNIDSAYEISNIKMDGLHVINADVHWTTGSRGYRLPTEAEWEFACRAGTITPFPYGNTISTDQANYDGTVSYFENNKTYSKKETQGIFRKRPVEVDSLLPNNFGLYNIVGNVFEWCWDYYGKYSPQHQYDRTGPDTGTGRIRRSGAYGSPGYHMRSSLRHGIPLGVALFHMGLRVAKNI